MGMIVGHSRINQLTLPVRPNLFDFQSEYTFGSEDNTTFLVYVYDFQPPLWIIISFSQHPKLDLLQFFITFSTWVWSRNQDEGVGRIFVDLFLNICCRENSIEFCKCFNMWLSLENLYKISCYSTI